MENLLDTEKKGLYLYGIIRNDKPIEFGPIGIGEGGDRVYGINYKDICAIVSQTSVMRYEAKRKYLLTHELVQEEVMKRFPILPIRYSTISETTDDTKVVKLLQKEYEKFSDLLREMEDKKELRLRAIALEEQIYKYILDKHEKIRTYKEEVALLPPDQSHFQLMEIGKMVESALIEENYKFKEAILNAIAFLAEKVKINDNYGERMIVNAAFLVQDNKLEAFDKAIRLLDKQYGNLIIFRYAGPLPPYNFVNLVININKNGSDNV